MKVLAPGKELAELILVNDESADNSWAVVQELANRHAWIRGINLMRNYGQHNALLCGIRLAKFPMIVTMDDDLQTPPEEIPGLLAKLAEGYDVVYGTPRNAEPRRAPRYGLVVDETRAARGDGRIHARAA